MHESENTTRVEALDGMMVQVNYSNFINGGEREGVFKQLSKMFLGEGVTKNWKITRKIQHRGILIICVFASFTRLTVALSLHFKLI